jgi:osmotically inducible protein OsmC
MAEFVRTANAVWKGDLFKGEGVISASSGVLTEVPYSFVKRFENEPGTNPEELIAAAHAGCYSMALANNLAGQGYEVESIDTAAGISLSNESGGWAITKSRLTVKGKVKGIDAATFKEIAESNDCPVSTLLGPGLEIEIEAELL